MARQTGVNWSTVGDEALNADLVNQIANDIRGWDAIDDHRTGTSGDRRTSDWLASRVHDAGLSPRRDDFELSRWVLERCEIEVGQSTVEGIPLFDGGTTGPEGTVGTLEVLRNGTGGHETGFGPRIGVGELGHHASGGANRVFAEARATAAHAGLVAVAKMDDGVPGLALQNADRFAAPFGPPALQVATEHEAWLLAAAKRREPARLTAHVTLETAFGSNIYCRAQGLDSTLAPLVVMTPKSAWWVCTAERGGGIAVWLALLRDFVVRRPNRDVVFIATSGHELGHLGLEHYLATDPVEGARAWIHLGANFGAVGSQTRIQAADADLLDLARTSMKAAGLPPPTVTPLGQRPVGEARNVHDLGEPYVSFLGTNAWFHHPDDRWPATTDLDKIRRMAEAILAIARRMDRE